eukprot:GEMP01012070.1.p1 GENE.GEMP01012070.1~~GEMP01012070.1.p1  ORF type:complete len:643 (+),score=129.59 GEMP01012070.1:161-2089(+)
MVDKMEIDHVDITKRFSSLQVKLLGAGIHFFHRHIRCDDEVERRMAGNKSFRIFYEKQYHHKLDLNKIFADSVHDSSPLHVSSFILSILHQGIFSVASFVISVIYLSRFKEASQITLHTSTWRPLFVTTLLIADKMWEDKPVRNSSLVKLFPVLTNTELNLMESNLLLQTQFNTVIKPDLFCSFCEKLLAEAVNPEILRNVKASEYTISLAEDSSINCFHQPDLPTPGYQEEQVQKNGQCIHKPIVPRQFVANSQGIIGAIAGFCRPTIGLKPVLPFFQFNLLNGRTIGQPNGQSPANTNPQPNGQILGQTNEQANGQMQGHVTGQVLEQPHGLLNGHSAATAYGQMGIGGLQAHSVGHAQTSVQDETSPTEIQRPHSTGPIVRLQPMMTTVQLRALSANPTNKGHTLPTQQQGQYIRQQQHMQHMQQQKQQQQQQQQQQLQQQRHQQMEQQRIQKQQQQFQQQQQQAQFQQQQQQQMRQHQVRQQQIQQQQQKMRHQAQKQYSSTSPRFGPHRPMGGSSVSSGGSIIQPRLLSPNGIMPLQTQTIGVMVPRKYSPAQSPNPQTGVATVPAVAQAPPVAQAPNMVQQMQRRAGSPNMVMTPPTILLGSSLPPGDRGRSPMGGLFVQPRIPSLVLRPVRLYGR